MTILQDLIFTFYPRSLTLYNHLWKLFGLSFVTPHAYICFSSFLYEGRKDVNNLSIIFFRYLIDYSFSARSHGFLGLPGGSNTAGAAINDSAGRLSSLKA